MHFLAGMPYSPHLMQNCLVLNTLKNYMLKTTDFVRNVELCEKIASSKFFKHDGFLFRENKLCVPNCSMREILVQESHGGRLMGHFGVAKTLPILLEHFYWPHMKRDVKRICGRCVTCRQAKSKV